MKRSQSAEMKKKVREPKQSKGGALKCSCGGKLSYVAGVGLRCLKCGEVAK